MDPLTIGGLIFTAATAASLVGLHASKVKVPRRAKWDAPPPVYVSEQAPVTLAEVREAVDWWRDKGFEFGAVMSTKAFQSTIPNAIFIGLNAGLQDERAGQADGSYMPGDGHEDEEAPPMDYFTELSDSADFKHGVMRSSVIGIAPLEPHWNVQTLLRHELGHALGFDHTQTSLFGYRRKDKKNGKRQAGEARRFLGIKVVGRKTGHVMNPALSACGDITTGMVP